MTSCTNVHLSRRSFGRWRAATTGMRGCAKVTSLAIYTGLDHRHSLAYRGMTAQASPQRSLRLHDTDRRSGRPRSSRLVPESQVESTGLRVEADAVFKPPPVEHRQWSNALIAGANRPIDLPAHPLTIAFSHHIQSPAGARVSQ